LAQQWQLTLAHLAGCWLRFGDGAKEALCDCPLSPISAHLWPIWLLGSGRLICATWKHCSRRSWKNANATPSFGASRKHACHVPRRWTNSISVKRRRWQRRDPRTGEGGYIERAEPIIFIGDCGTGKTHLLTGLCIAACRQKRRVRFATAAALVKELVEAKQQLQLQLRRVLARWECYDLIAID
jgi:hypothetical protein